MLFFFSERRLSVSSSLFVFFLAFECSLRVMPMAVCLVRSFFCIFHCKSQGLQPELLGFSYIVIHIRKFDWTWTFPKSSNKKKRLYWLSIFLCVSHRRSRMSISRIMSSPGFSFTPFFPFFFIFTILYVTSWYLNFIIALFLYYAFLFSFIHFVFFLFFFFSGYIRLMGNFRAFLKVSLLPEWIFSELAFLLICVGSWWRWCRNKNWEADFSVFAFDNFRLYLSLWL